MNIFAKNSIVAILTVTLVIPLGFGLFIPIAHATTDDGNSGSFISSCLGAGLLENLIGVGPTYAGVVVPVEDADVIVNTGTVRNKECVLDGLATTIREVLISSLTRSIVNWINSGFDGEPAFITDLKGFFLDIADQVVGRYIEGNEELAFLCSPFSIDVRIAIALDYYATTRDRISCTLTGVLQNIEDAFGDFSSGSAWDSWYQFSINPVNNALGAFLAGRNAMRLSIAGAQSIESQKADWGRGIRSEEACEEDPDTGIIFCEIITPGAIINEQINQVIGSGFRQLELADEINEIIGAFLSQMSKQVLGGGGGLSGLSRNRQGRPAYVDRLVEESDRNSESEFRSYGISLIDGAISIENPYLSAKNISLINLGISESLLNSLSECYTAKLTSQNLSLTSAQRTTATERKDAATSTIAMNIAPLRNLITNDISQSQDNISALLVIKENLQNATSRLSVESILINEFEPLIENRIIHFQSDFNIALQQGRDIVGITEAMNEAANTNLVICEAFPNEVDSTGVGDEG